MDASKVDDLLDYLGVDPLRRGRRGSEYTFRCPLHGDSKPSAAINPSAELWNCATGCGGGPVPFLIAAVRGVPVRQAVEIFKSYGGGTLSWDDIRTRLDMVDRPPQKRTWLSQTQLEALPYDRSLRWITPEVEKHFNIRWYQDKHCAVVPFYDRHFVYAGHTARFDESVAGFRHGKPQGLNPSEYLFGLPQSSWDKTKQVFRTRVIVVEGPRDVMWLYQNGIKNAVGLFGSKVSDAHALLLRRSPGVLVWLDNDRAGWLGLWSALKRLSPSVPTRTVDYPPGMDDLDPGDLPPPMLEACLRSTTALTRGVVQRITAKIPRKKT